MAEGSLPRPFGDIGRRAASPARSAPNARAARRDAVWRALWAPYWVGSEMPAPAVPGRESGRPAEVGLAGDVVLRGLGQVRRRLWLRHALAGVVRGLWLGVAIACLWLLVELAGGPAARWPWLVGVGAVTLSLGILFGLLARPTGRQTARMLDRSFALQERLTTAVDHLGRGVPREGERASVVYLQMADAANVVAELRRHRALGVRIPVRELVLTIFFGLVLAALFFLRGVGGEIPALAAGGVPAFTPAVERTPEPEPAAAPSEQAELTPTVEEVRQRAERANEAQRDLQSLATALQDHAVTRSAAESIGEGAYEAAADDLRELAPDADRLSPAAREELARDLDEAASGMSPGGDELAQAAEQAAAGLRRGEQPAQEGVRELGDAVEETGDEVASREELAEQMRQAEAAEAQGEQGQPGQQGQQAGQPGQPGEPGAAQPGQEGAPGEGQPGQGRPGEAGEGQAGQPGEGDPRQAGEGDSASGQGGVPGGQEGQPGEGQPGGQPGEGQPGAPGGEASGDGQQSGQGGGAGSGDAEENAGEGDPGGAGGEGQEEAAQGVPAEERVSEGDGAGAETGEPAPVTETIQLPPGGNGEGVQTSNDAGGSRAGTGAGVTAGAGTTVQGEVGETGPDSNRVPPAHRSVVERYFGEPPAPEAEGG